MDEEARGIAQQILNTLAAAGVSPVNMIGCLGSVGGFAPGIQVAGHDARLVETIEKALTSFGQFVNSGDKTMAYSLLSYPGGDFPDAKSSAAAIFVGTKPLPMLKK
jgi:hypothetical protein